MINPRNIKAKHRRDRLRALGVCISGESHGPATHGVLCERCRLVHSGKSPDAMVPMSTLVRIHEHANDSITTAGVDHNNMATIQSRLRKVHRRFHELLAASGISVESEASQ